MRLIGINAPESVDPRRPVQCFGREASAEMKRLVGGQAVSLETDPSQDLHDKYGRLLAYVFLQDGTNVNLHMIEAGFAYEYTYDLPYKYQRQFKAAQKDAQAEGRGLWAAGACGGKL
jgi:micrococcal nuclease